MMTLKLLYVHGYNGQENGNASKLVENALVKRGIDFTLNAPKFPVTEPAKMLSKLRELISSQHYDYVIASSLGAFYAMQLGGMRKILINPAVPDNLLKLREADPVSNPELTDELLDSLRGIQNHFLTDICDDEFQSETYFIYGNQDTIAGNEDFYGKYYPTNISWQKVPEHVYHVDMGHRVEAAGAEMVRNIIEKLE